MFGTIRRHQTWLWVVIGSLTILSFVIFGPTTSTRIGDFLSGGKNAGMMNGRPIPIDDYTKAYQEVRLNYFLSHNQWPENDQNARRSGFDEKRETYFRLKLIDLQKQYGIQISSEAVATFARQIIGQAPFDELMQKVLVPGKVTADDFERYLRHQAGIQELIMAAGIAGKLVSPQEAEEMYRKEHEELAVEAVFFNASNYLARVTVTPEVLAQYYSNRQANYVIPVRRSVDYVKWNVTNYLGNAEKAITNMAAIVDANYMQGTNFYKGATNAEEAKAFVKRDAIRAHAMLDARREAAYFAEKLDDAKSGGPAKLKELAEKEHLKVMTTEPFDQTEGPKDLDVPTRFIRVAFGLTVDEPFSAPVEAEDGVYVMAKNKEFPSEIPPLKNVEAKVTGDFKMIQAAQSARLAGSAFAVAVTNGLAQGKAFDTIAADQKYTVEKLPPFSLSTRSLPPNVEDQIDSATLKQIAFTTQVGKASPFVPSQEGGMLLYVKSKLPVDEAKMKTELANFTTYVRNVRQNDSFNQWFMHQAQMDAEFTDTMRKVLETPQMRSSGQPPGS